MKNKNLIVYAFVGMALFQSCEQNPYPKNTDSGKITEKQVNAEPVFPAYSLQMDEILPCEEGTLCKMKIIPHVPDGITPILNFEGLPEGAVYNLKTSELEYNPSFEVVDLTKDPTRKNSIFKVTALLTTAFDPITATKKTFSISVNNVNRPLKIDLDTSLSVLENTSCNSQFTIESEDLPDADYKIQLIDAPLWVSVVQKDKKNNHLFDVVCNPSRATVLNSSENTFNFKMMVLLPSGQSEDRSMKIEVLNDIVKPLISAPEVFEQGIQGQFTIRAEDLNFEKAPFIKKVTPVPFGKLTVDLIESKGPLNGSYPTSLFKVNFEGLTAENFGKEIPVTFTICTSYDSSYCSDYSMKYVLKANAHLAPTVDRTKWKVSELKTVKVDETFTIALPILDAENSKNKVSIKILPESMNEFVQYSNGSLKIKTKNEGIQQFSIVSTSMYDQSSSESFLFDALPKSWSSTVILGGYQPSLETKLLLNKLDKAELLSAAYQFDEAHLRMRKNLIITTDALTIPNIGEKIISYRKYFKNIVISSPIVAVSNELKTLIEKNNIELSQRLVQPVTQYSLTVDRSANIEDFKVPAGLSGKTTKESNSPQSFNLKNSSCRILFHLQKVGQNNDVGFSCVDGNQKITILGFELADIILSANDSEILKSWMNVWMTE